MRTRGWAILGATAAAATAGAAAFILHEKRVEQPPYTLVERDGPIEVRRYPALLVAETEAGGPRTEALGAGFRRLANYIFAKDRGGAASIRADRAEPIAMTAPVLSDRRGETWRTRFVMPAAYSAVTLPAPGPGVQIATLPARRVAAYRFAGYASDAMLTKAEARLRAWIAEQGLDAGEVSYAFYNSPFMPGPLRRNEVLIALK